MKACLVRWGLWVSALALPYGELVANEYAANDVKADAQNAESYKPAASPHKINANHGGKSLGSVDQMLVGLQKRLDTQPDDVKGWVLLAKSYHHIGRMHEAEQAAEKARSLGYKKDILPELKSGHSTVPKTAIKGDSRKMPNDHHHRAVTSKDAGTYVSSFFENLDSDAAPNTPPQAAEE